MNRAGDTTAAASFDLRELVERFPESAATMLMNQYLVDREAASARLTRTYRSTPAHLHRHCDEHLLVLSGRGTFWMEDPSQAGEFGPGTFLFFRRGVVHALPELLESPVTFLAIDVPRRRPEDIVFVDAGDGTPDQFVSAVD